MTDENKKPVCSVNQMTPQTTLFAYLSDGIGAGRCDKVHAKRQDGMIKEAAFDG